MKRVTVLALIISWGSVLAAQAPPLTKAEQLQEAARKGDAVMVTKLLDEGVDVNTKFRYNATALFYACDHGHLEVVKVLLARGADLTAKDTFYGFTPLALAIGPAQKKKPEHAEIAKLLIAKGAPGKETALGAALQSGDTALAKFILDSGGLPADVLSDALEAAKALKKADDVTMLERAGAKPYEDFKIDEAQLSRFAGTYRNAAGNEAVIAAAGGRLIGTPRGGPPLVLSPRDATTFRMIGMAGATMTFTIEDGKVTGFAIALPGRPSQTYTRTDGKSL